MVEACAFGIDRASTCKTVAVKMLKGNVSSSLEDIEEYLQDFLGTDGKLNCKIHEFAMVEEVATINLYCLIHEFMETLSIHGGLRLSWKHV